MQTQITTQEDLSCSGALAIRIHSPLEAASALAQHAPGIPCLSSLCDTQTLFAHPDIDVVGSPERRELERLQFARRCFWFSEVRTHCAHGALLMPTRDPDANPDPGPLTVPALAPDPLTCRHTPTTDRTPVRAP